jgi:hypothetical protein
MPAPSKKKVGVAVQARPKKKINVQVLVAIIGLTSAVVVAIITGAFGLLVKPTTDTPPPTPTSTPISPSDKCYGGAQQVAITVIRGCVQRLEKPSEA